tara:strand:- start:15358 stop:16308 length:951 start_codon:yes stop_codon:yes gene_type:complete
LSFLSWWFGDRATPVLIPNTEVKPVSTDGSRKARVGHRQLRELKTKYFAKYGGVFCFSGIIEFMSWSSKNRSIYLGGLILILVIVFALPVYNIFNKEPTCFDGKQNSNERGVDCGGGCEKICGFTVAEPLILWTRSFEVRDGVYNSVAMIENPNLSAGAQDVFYTFTLLDDKGVLVYERKGKTDIPAQTRFPIFEGTIVTRERAPDKTFFEFTSKVEWLTQENISSNLRINKRGIINTDSSPRVDVELENRGFVSIKDVELFAIIYDMADNAMASSKTLVENISPDSMEKVTFTWPNPFKSPIGRVEILPKFGTRN